MIWQGKACLRGSPRWPSRASPPPPLVDQPCSLGKGTCRSPSGTSVARSTWAGHRHITYITLHYIVTLHHVVAVTLHHVTLHHVTLRHVTSRYQVQGSRYHFTSRHITSRHVPLPGSSFEVPAQLNLLSSCHTKCGSSISDLLFLVTLSCGHLLSFSS